MRRAHQSPRQPRGCGGFTGGAQSGEVAMDELQQAISKLRSLSPRLNSAVEQAQRVVLQVEHFLVHECQLAVQAEVPVSYNDKGVAVTLLRYGRVNGKFHIALTQTDGDARFVSRAWVDCDRNEKLASF